VTPITRAAWYSPGKGLEGRESSRFKGTPENGNLEGLSSLNPHSWVRTQICGAETDRQRVEILDILPYMNFDRKGKKRKRKRGKRD